MQNFEFFNSNFQKFSKEFLNFCFGTPNGNVAVNFEVANFVVVNVVLVDVIVVDVIFVDVVLVSVLPVIVFDNEQLFLEQYSFSFINDCNCIYVISNG